MAGAMGAVDGPLRQPEPRRNPRDLRRILCGATPRRQVRAPCDRWTRRFQPVDEVGQSAGGLHAPRRCAAPAGRRCTHSRPARRPWRGPHCAGGLSRPAGARTHRAPQLQERRAAEAEPTLKQALDIDGTNPKANCTLALLYLASNRGTEAEPYLKAYADAAKTAASRLALADYYTSFDRPDDALPILDAILANDAPAYAAAQSRLAALEFMRGKKNEAHKRHDDLLTRQPKFTVGLVMKARFLLSEHQLDEALAQATAAAKEDPASAQRQFLLGRAYAATDQPDESERAFNDVLKLNPRAVAVYPHLARVQLSNGKPDLAVRSARQAINGGADHPDAHLLLARSLIACHELAAAEAELKALATRYPNVAAVHNQIAAWHLAKGHPVDAKRSFERALALDAKSIEALSGLVDLDLAAGKAADAQGKVGAALTRAPADARVLLMAGETYAALGDPDRAEAPLKRAIEIDPGSLRAYALLGHLFVATGKLESAKAEFEAFAERRPGTSAAIAGQTMVGLILETQNRLGDAQAVYEKILTVSPRAVVAANNLAWLYAERGANLHVALNLAQAVAQQVPDRPEIDDTLGRIYYKKELATLAIPAFRRSVEKDATNPLYHYHLGLTYTKTRDWTRAKQSLEKALGLSTNFDGATDARKVLASISG